MRIMQGDASMIPCSIKDAGTAINAADLLKVEFTVLGFTKHWRSGKNEVAYDGQNDCWNFPITQKESMSKTPAVYPAQARVYYQNGSVVGVSLGEIEVIASESKEIL